MQKTEKRTHASAHQANSPTCDSTKRTFQIDMSFVGYGCTSEEAKADFYSQVLKKIEADCGCKNGQCDGGVCVPELVDTAEVDAALKCNRVTLERCPGHVGFKCYLVDQPGVSTPHTGRCTCAPATLFFASLPIASSKVQHAVQAHLKAGDLAQALQALREKPRKKQTLPCPYDEIFELDVMNGAGLPKQQIERLLEDYYRSLYQCDDPMVCRLSVVVQLQPPRPGSPADFLALIHIRCSAAPL